MKHVKIEYTDWRGERRERIIRPLHNGISHTKNQFHPEPQWLLTAVDVEDGKVKTFAMSGIHSWANAYD